MLNVPLSPDIEEKLRAKAAVAGLDVQTFVALTLERAALRPPIDEVLAPLAAEYEASGMSEDELIELLESAKHEARSERRANRGT